VPTSAKAKLLVSVQAIREGRAVWDEWTFFPRGEPIRVKLHFAPIRLDDGRIGALQHAYPPDEGPDPARLRGIEALTHTSVIIAVVDFDGAILFKNPAAVDAFGVSADAWKEWLAEPPAAERMLRAAAAGEVSRGEVSARTVRGERWHAVEVQPVRDAVTGREVALVHHTDETARRGAEEEAENERRLVAQLNQSLALVERQRQEILELSAPVLEVGDRTLAVPLIGSLDRARAAEVAGRLLSAISERRARTVILDLTGAASLDGSSAELLIHMIRAIKLLGARPIMTGIRPALARWMVESGLDLADAAILRSLADGIRFSARAAGAGA
jgi:anti-anti-sigma regulatory factor